LKILHTSDLHLKEINDERWEALLHLINICKTQDVSLLTISGDLFDRGIDSEKLRPELREIFSDNDFKIVLIPGNHDANSFDGGKYYGKDVNVILDVEKPVEIDDIAIWGLPFAPVEEGDVLKSLHKIEEKINKDKINILLYHGELLDSFFLRADFGEEGKQRYMPARLSYFQKVGFNYILAGHFHTTFDLIHLENGGYFVYPGSPVSISRRELGRRKVCIIEPGNIPLEYPLDTAHYQNITVRLDPFSSSNPVMIVKDYLEKAPLRAKVILTVTGYINSDLCQMKESELSSALNKEVKDKCIEYHFEYLDIQRILNDELFLTFREKLKAKGYESSKMEKLSQIAIKAMMEAGI